MKMSNNSRILPALNISCIISVFTASAFVMITAWRHRAMIVVTVNKVDSAARPENAPASTCVIALVRRTLDFDLNLHNI